MDRPIIVLTQAPGQALALAYLGTDYAVAEKVFEKESQNQANESAAIYYYPAPRLTSTPASNAVVAALSKACQRDPQKDRIYAEAKVAARNRLTDEAKAKIEVAAIAEAEAAVAASEVAGQAIARIVAQSSTPEAAQSAVVSEVLSAVETAQQRADREAEPAEPIVSAPPSAESSAEELDESAQTFAPPPRRKR
jgi:hypothetical protein